MPRQQKSRESFEELSNDNNLCPKQLSPVRDDILDVKDQAEEISYQEKKQFWETISKDSKPSEAMLAKKRQSVQEEVVPVPKPRAILQFSHSVSEAPSDYVAAIKTERKTEKIEISEKDIPRTEYQASFIPPQQQTPRSPIETQLSEQAEYTEEEDYPSETQYVEDSKSSVITEESQVKLSKSDSLDSESDTGGQDSGDNAGYISDCGDVEHYISDSEIEDRVPQIRERQMSVFVPPSVSQRTRYERSASLPTEDLYEVSARSTQLRKQYYEEQIKKEMIKEQLTIDLEDDISPERKSIEGSTIDMPIEKDSIDNETSSELIKQVDQSLLKEDHSKTVENIGIHAIDTDVSSLVHIEASDEVEKFEENLSNFRNDVFQAQYKDNFAEVHVDKSETEKSEKFITDDIKLRPVEGDKEQSKTSPLLENIPEITFSLSGKQRRISEESDEYAKDDVNVDLPISEQAEIEEDENLAQNYGTIPHKSDQPAKTEAKAETKDDKVIEEGTSLNKPEENITQTVWEVSVESEMLKEEEITSLPSIPTAIKTQCIRDRFELPSERLIEREDDLSSEVRDESDLGSEIHQDHSDTYSSDKIKSDSHSDMKKIILDSLHQQKVDPEEAKIIANSLIEEIELEIQKVENFNRGLRSKSESLESEKQVTDYLKELAEAKGLDQREVELVESVLERRQRQISKLTRGDTQASSMEITDEDLRYSEGDLDYSHILAQQMGQLEAEYCDNSKNIYDSLVHGQDEIHSSRKSSETSSKEQGYSEDSTSHQESTFKADKQMSHEEVISSEKLYTDIKTIIVEEDETISESAVKELEKTCIHSKTETKEFIEDDNAKQYDEKIVEVDAIGESKSQVEAIRKESSGKVEEAFKVDEHLDISAKSKDKSKSDISTFDEDSRVMERIETEKDIETDLHTSEHLDSVSLRKSSRNENDEFEVVQMTEEIKKQSTASIQQTQEVTHQVTSTSDSTSKDQTTDKMMRTSSTDSKSSIGSGKSPDEFSSPCSSGKRMESEASADVILRKSKTSSDSGSIKHDRKSAIELENYSSSGESHYHSFEIDNKSRPCSSDIEGIIPTGSSEYESALNSQELSIRSQATSGEYHTAVSSLSSKESMRSFESESSGNLASIEVSEASETLVPTSSDLEGDIDIVDQQLLEDMEPLWPMNSDASFEDIKKDEIISTEYSNDSLKQHQSAESDKFVDIPSKMKRSYEMTFQPEPKVLTADSPHTESNDLEEKFGTSLDEGSVLSVSLSSTSSAQLRTVIELSRTESGGLEESLTSVLSEHFSMEDADSRHKDAETPTQMHSSTSTIPPTNMEESIESVTILSASFTENGTSNACSQVTTEVTQSTGDAQKPSHDELKKKGHRRQESTSFIPTFAHPSQKPSDSTIGQVETKHDKIESSEFESSYKIEENKGNKVENIIARDYQDKNVDLSYRRESSERRDSHGKSSTTSSERSSFEEAEAEAVFNRVAHISPVHKVKQICPIMEDIDAEKHELEAKELAEKEKQLRASQLKDASPGFIPDITVTEDTAPLDESNFRYPELEMERNEQERETQKFTESETPASNSSKSSEDTDQGREYVLEDRNMIIEEPETPDEKACLESRSEIDTMIEKTLNEETRTSDSPNSANSDSFELIEKPDIIDDFVVIEEVGKEASEMDSEGKSVNIQVKSKRVKKHNDEIDAYLAKSDPTPLTKMTELKYFPPGPNDELEFDFENSPPQKKDGTSSRDYGMEYDRELEANRKWIEEQFHGDQAAMAAAGYGYEMEFERGPLEDIKEEDINDMDLASSRIGSLGSQKESGGSLGSVKDSYSSTPEYDVLAGRKYFTKSGEHDDVSMSSLQEFENLERAMSLETRKFQHSSGDSSSNGSFKTRYYASKGQGDDISVSSLKEFEGLEKACIAVHRTEIIVKEEEESLSHIEEVQESLPSETETPETAAVDKKVPESDEEDYEKRMFEIDEIIRQAQNNVERFTDLKEPEKTESLGRGDSIEEVSRVPELDLDAPLDKAGKKVVNKEEDPMVTSTDSLDLSREKPAHYDSTDSLDQKNNGRDMMTVSTDSIELNNQLSKGNFTTDSMDTKLEDSHMVCSDSLELAAAATAKLQVDSLEDDELRIYPDQSSSDTGKDFSSSVKDDAIEHDENLHDLMLGSTDSLEPTSSAATHATYQYETDSVFSGSFTSGGSNTMVSSTDTIDPNQSVDITAAVRKVWYDEHAGASGGTFTAEYFEESSMPYVTEVIEPSDDPHFSHTIHRRVELPAEITKMTFHGKDADEQLQQFIKDFHEGQEVQEMEETDAAGNVHVKKVVQNRYIIRSEDSIQTSTINQQFSTKSDVEETAWSRQFELPPAPLTSLTNVLTGETTAKPSGSHDSSALKDESSQESSSDKQEGEIRSQPFDQHQLSDEMKELLKEMEKSTIQ